jgi:hypothetical protein
MKHLKTFGQINELKSLEYYDFVQFTFKKVSNDLKRLTEIGIDEEGRALTGFPTEKQLVNTTSKAVIDSIIEFYQIEDNKRNRNKINSIFNVYYNVYLGNEYSVGNLQIHIKNKERDFQTIYFGQSNRVDDLMLKVILEKIKQQVESKFTEELSQAEFKKNEILPYVKSKFQGDDFAKSIYDWNTTFETLEKLFYEYSFDNLEDADYEKYVGIIDRNLDKLKEYVEKNDYKTYIGYEKMYPNIVFETLEQSMIYDKKYFSEYINSLRDIGISKKLFDKDFIEFLDKFKKFISK